ncbi:synaptic vesicle glycoprotein 2B-like isoform X3 [Leguminivora glycinivorella]|nr:synaptic vesicle glycoprotein 2B-like isoform X2 [Leguminivora glycinivorella]XP_048001448.1 synaptic vesicle glycoprotein 2B-like isoform X3 [Leguminivora glycinivorella]
MAAVPVIGILATSHVWGYLADMRGRRKILQLSLVLGFITGALAAFSPHWIVFCILKFLSCTSVSGTFALAFTLLGETTPRTKRNMVILMASSIYLLSTGVMAILTIPVLPLTFSYYVPYLGIYLNSWRLLNIIYSLPCAIAAIVIARVDESPKYLLTMGLADEALSVIKRMYVVNTGKDLETFEVKSIILNEDATSGSQFLSLWASVKAQTLPLVKPPLLRNTILLSIMYALIYFCIHPYIVWLPFIADGFMKSIDKGETGLTICQMLRSAHTSQNQSLGVIEEVQDCTLNQFAMMIVLINGCVLGMMNFVMSGLINLVGRKRLLIAVQIITGTAGVCINFSSSWAATSAIFMAFIANCLNFAVLTTFSVNIFPTYLKAMAVCLTLMVGRTCAFFGINILKQMLISDCELSFYMFGGLTIVGGILGFLLPGDEQQHKQKQNRAPET